MLTGYEALQQSVSPDDRAELTSERQKHRNNPTDPRILGHYLKMNKVLVGEKGAHELGEMAHELEDHGSKVPFIQHARAWMLIESSLAAGDSMSHADRSTMLQDATGALEHALKLTLADGNKLARYKDCSLRMALAMAHIPLAQAIVNGDVDTESQRSVASDTSSIARTYIKHVPAQQRTGLTHEMLALGLLHAIEDPRYVALPSTLRGDSGIYNKTQTHDLSVIKQHFGEIRQVQPIEVKNRVINEHRERYWPTLLSGEDLLLRPDGTLQTHMTVLRALRAAREGRANEQQRALVSYATNALITTLSRYKTTGRPIGSKMNTKTRFYGVKHPRDPSEQAA